MIRGPCPPERRRSSAEKARNHLAGERMGNPPAPVKAGRSTRHGSLGAGPLGPSAFYIDLLEDQGVYLDEPYTRQLRGKLRELRFYMGRERQRVAYYIAGNRRIILLTVFRKTRARESQEIDRAERAMQQCIASGHTAEDENA